MRMFWRLVKWYYLDLLMKFAIILVLWKLI